MSKSGMTRTIRHPLRLLKYAHLNIPETLNTLFNKQDAKLLDLKGMFKVQTCEAGISQSILRVGQIGPTRGKVTVELVVIEKPML